MTREHATSYRRRRRRRARGAAGAACIVVLTAIVATAHAHVDALLWRGGETLLRYGRALDQDEPRWISINGAELRIASGRSPEALADVLDVFEQRCKRSGGDFGEQLRRSSLAPGNALRDPKAERWSLLDGVLRRSVETRGVVACFDLGGRPVAANELARRLRAFLAEGDLGSVGELRVMWAERDAGTTSYLAVSSRGSLPLRAMFPGDGDAPGMDAPELPRPAHARRVLSAWPAQRAPLLVAYRSELGPAASRATYRAQLHAAGFEVQVDRGAGDGSSNWLVRRGAALSAAVITRDGSGSTLVLSPWR